MGRRRKAAHGAQTSGRMAEPAPFNGADDAVGDGAPFYPANTVGSGLVHAVPGGSIRPVCGVRAELERVGAHANVSLACSRCAYWMANDGQLDHGETLGDYFRRGRARALSRALAPVRWGGARVSEIVVAPPIAVGWDQLMLADRRSSPLAGILQLARSSRGWEGDFEQGPAAFAVPGREGRFVVGYAWKAGDETTFIAMPKGYALPPGCSPCLTRGGAQ